MESAIGSHISQILKLVSPKTTLVIDDAISEILHWSTGLSSLFEHGVIDIKQFSSFAVVAPHSSSLLFVVSSLLAGQVLTVIIDIIQSSVKVEKVSIVTPFSENFHTSAEVENNRNDFLSFNAIKNQLRTCSPSLKTVEIHHIPIFACFLQTNLKLFVTPAFDDFFGMCFSQSLQSSDVPTMILEQFPPPIQLLTKKFAGAFWRMFVQLNATFNVYSIGPLSRLVSTHLASIPPPKTATEKYSIVFVDRALDLVAPFHHSDKCFAEQLFKSFSPLTVSSNDVNVPLNQVMLPHIQLAGSLAHPENESHENLMRRCFSRKRREIQTATFRQLLDICFKEGLDLPEKFSKPDFSSVKTIFSVIASNREVLRRHGSILELIAAIWLSSNDLRFDEIQKVEKSVLQNLGSEDSPSAASQIISLLQTKTGKLPFTNICSLMVSCFSLCKNDEVFDSMTEEEQLITAFTTDCQSSSICGKGDDKNVEQIIMSDPAKFLSLIKTISTMRNNLSQYTDLFFLQDSIPTYRPILEQICTDIFQNDISKETLDIECSSSAGIKSLIKTGFSYFMPVSKSRPVDCAVLIIFVLGGIAISEVKTIKDLATKHGIKCELYIGSTSLIANDQVLLEKLVRVDPVK